MFRYYPAKIVLWIHAVIVQFIILKTVEVSLKISQDNVYPRKFKEQYALALVVS